MARKRQIGVGPRTIFRDYIEQKCAADYDLVARELGKTHQYIRMLARGECTPQLGFAGIIEHWSKGEVTMQAWLPSCPKFVDHVTRRGR